MRTPTARVRGAGRSTQSIRPEGSPTDDHAWGDDPRRGGPTARRRPRRSPRRAGARPHRRPWCTDGAEDARDRAGRFFDLPGVLAREAAATPTRLVAGVHAALLRHTGGRLTDDVALLVLRNDRP
ncbi:SpoIIE family protein phosphatase [Streptomyces virginiae]|uniref:SpoIIE family protein phosphatase n=1 Tax=Streptomyces virginiae TaxID=1961 RepID=UPI0036AA15D9